mmetsp:Transcript_17921/g.33218  ORF Transcript_17921/g.33218 Transcript_17921/m.33218 type:complete len:521 (-) Transcript_17921:97-1659(-)
MLSRENDCRRVLSCEQKPVEEHKFVVIEAMRPGKPARRDIFENEEHVLVKTLRERSEGKPKGDPHAIIKRLSKSEEAEKKQSIENSDTSNAQQASVHNEADRKNGTEDEATHGKVMEENELVYDDDYITNKVEEMRSEIKELESQLTWQVSEAKRLAGTAMAIVERLELEASGKADAAKTNLEKARLILQDGILENTSAIKEILSNVNDDVEMDSSDLIIAMAGNKESVEERAESHNSPSKDKEERQGHSTSECVNCERESENSQSSGSNEVKEINWDSDDIAEPPEIVRQSGFPSILVKEDDDAIDAIFVENEEENSSPNEIADGNDPGGIADPDTSTLRQEVNDNVAEDDRETKKETKQLTVITNTEDETSEWGVSPLNSFEGFQENPIDGTLEAIYKKIEQCQSTLMNPEATVVEQANAAELMAKMAKVASIAESLNPEHHAKLFEESGIGSPSSQQPKTPIEDIESKIEECRETLMHQDAKVTDHLDAAEKMKIAAEEVIAQMSFDSLNSESSSSE